MTEQSIIEKIKALLAMAEHPNSNSNEAAMAMERAQTLLLKHNLSMSQIKVGDAGYQPPAGIGKIDVVESIGYQWKRVLLSTIAKASLCYIVVSPSENTIHLFGTYDNVKSVLEMYNWLKTQLTYMCDRNWLTYRETGGMDQVNTWKSSYYAGAVDEIKTRLQKPYQEFAKGQGSSLVVYNDKALSTAVHKIFPILGKSSSRVSVKSGDGIASGRQAGRNVSLSQSKSLGSRLALSA